MITRIQDSYHRGQQFASHKSANLQDTTCRTKHKERWSCMKVLMCITEWLLEGVFGTSKKKRLISFLQAWKNCSNCSSSMPEICGKCHEYWCTLKAVASHLLLLRVRHIFSIVSYYLAQYYKFYYQGCRAGVTCGSRERMKAWNLK
jgi:hypothetical protein